MIQWYVIRIIRTQMFLYFPEVSILQKATAGRCRPARGLLLPGACAEVVRPILHIDSIF